MRIVLTLLVSSLFFCCKSKQVILPDHLIKYVVVLEPSANPKNLKKDISFDLISYEKVDKELNHWAVDFKGLPKDSNKLKASLLNHPKVLTVFTMDQYEKFKLKTAKKDREGTYGGKDARKQ